MGTFLTSFDTGVNILPLYSNVYSGIVSDFLGKIGKMGRVLSSFDFWIIIFLKIDAKSHVVWKW